MSTSPLASLLPHFKKPEGEPVFSPNQIWLLRQPPAPWYLTFDDGTYGLPLHEPFVFVVLKYEWRRIDTETDCWLRILSLDGRMGTLQINPSVWTFDGWLYV